MRRGEGRSHDDRRTIDIRSRRRSRSFSKTFYMNKFNLKIILLQGAKHQHNMTMTRTMTMTAPLFKLGTILLLLRIDPTAALFSIELKPGTIECFTIQTPIDNHATLRYVRCF